MRRTRLRRSWRRPGTAGILVLDAPPALTLAIAGALMAAVAVAGVRGFDPTFLRPSTSTTS
jgi:hypothetical protein